MTFIPSSSLQSRLWTAVLDNVSIADRQRQINEIPHSQLGMTHLQSLKGTGSWENAVIVGMDTVLQMGDKNFHEDEARILRRHVRLEAHTHPRSAFLHVN